MHQIQGPLNVTLGVESTYSVVPADGTSYVWTVSGCDIISGQGTASIIVQWTQLGQGSIQVEVSMPSGDDIIIIDPTVG